MICLVLEDTRSRAVAVGGGSAEACEVYRFECSCQDGTGRFENVEHTSSANSSDVAGSGANVSASSAAESAVAMSHCMDAFAGIRVISERATDGLWLATSCQSSTGSCSHMMSLVVRAKASLHA